MAQAPNPSENPQRDLNWDRLAEERIRAAQEAGEFDRLPGFGKPIPGLDEPHDELWWVKEKLKREQLAALPPALEIRRDIEQTLAGVDGLKSEKAVRRVVSELNVRIRKASFAVTWGPPVDVMPLDIEEVVSRWRTRQDPCRANT